jgi:Ca2+-binding EF-hand superfamily protein
MAVRVTIQLNDQPSISYLSPRVSSGQIDHICNEHDTNKDGYIDYIEYKAVMKSMSAT